MKAHEATIVEIARLISVKKKLIEKMHDDQEVIKGNTIEDITLEFDTSFGNVCLFEKTKLTEEFLQHALKCKMEWIVDCVYDRSIKATEDLIATNMKTLKRQLSLIDEEAANIDEEAATNE